MFRLHWFRLLPVLVLFLAGVVLISAQTQVNGSISAIRWRSDNTKIAIGYNDGNIEIRNVMTGNSSYLEPSNVAIRALSWNPTDPDLLAASYSGGLFVIFDVSTRELVYYEYTEADDATEVDWNQDGTKLAVSYAYTTNGHFEPTPYIVTIWDPSNGNLLNTLEGHVNSVNSVSWSNLPNDNRLISAGDDHQVILWDGDTGTEITHWATDFAVIKVVWAPDTA